MDNHDVSRIATILTNKNHLPLVYALMFGMPGIPCIYYGSEWGAEGDKNQGDPALRVSFEQSIDNDLSAYISKLAQIHHESPAICYGDFSIPLLTNRQCIIQRRCETERILVAINADEHPYTAHFDAGCGMADELITGTKHDFGGGSELPPYSAKIWKMER